MRHDFFMEFGYDMMVGVPTAWWLHQREKLTETHGPAGSRHMYFFSPKHVEHPDESRHLGWHWSKSLPMPDIHAADVTHWPTWSLPPFRMFYRWNKPRYDKPLLLICNKYNQQWSVEGPSPNHISIDSLRTIIGTLRGDYVIVYARYPWEDDDLVTVHPFDDFEVIKREFPEVILLHETVQGGADWNRRLFELCANAEAMLSVQGGTAIACSFFGGRNFIFAAMGDEIYHDSYSWYPNISGCDVQYVRTQSWEKIYHSEPDTGLRKPAFTQIGRDIQGEYVDLVLSALGPKLTIRMVKPASELRESEPNGKLVEV
jgi:hypothetical protein